LPVLVPAPLNSTLDRFVVRLFVQLVPFCQFLVRLLSGNRPDNHPCVSCCFANRRRPPLDADGFTRPSVPFKVTPAVAVIANVPPPCRSMPTIAPMGNAWAELSGMVNTVGEGPSYGRGYEIGASALRTMEYRRASLFGVIWPGLRSPSYQIAHQIAPLVPSPDGAMLRIQGWI
jgi:hypothetical protein